jgi:uncharacterized protein YndB with AHSA1/START domain
MRDEYRTREGFLLLADISGYTKFLTGTELEHAQAIIRELTMLVRNRLVPPMTFVKLEGDAVFCYHDGAAFRDGERLIELIEVCYFDFSNRLVNMARNTTCPCAACAAIGRLDLKFVCHHGCFVVDSDNRGVDLAGPDVILIHRLLKNGVTEDAYALFTEACMGRLPEALTLPRHEEHYDSFGAVTTAVHDLTPVLTAMRNARQIEISSEDADLVFDVEVPVPPAKAWSYWVDPIQRQRWNCRLFSDKPDRVTRNANGRVGPGTAAHCNHGPGTWRLDIVDWQPFSHVTFDVAGSRTGKYVGMRDQFMTFDFLPTPNGGTRVVQRIRLKHRGKLSLASYRAARRGMVTYWRRGHQRLLEVIADDSADA